MITSTKLYVPAVTLSINDNVKFLKDVKEGLKRTIYWNKDRSKITTQTKNNNLDYLIQLDHNFDPNFRNINRLFILSLKNANLRNINRLFILSLKNGDDDLTRYSFDKYNIQRFQCFD